MKRSFSFRLLNLTPDHHKILCFPLFFVGGTCIWILAFLSPTKLLSTFTTSLQKQALNCVLIIPFKHNIINTKCHSFTDCQQTLRVLIIPGTKFKDFQPLYHQIPPCGLWITRCQILFIEVNITGSLVEASLPCTHVYFAVNSSCDSRQ